METVIFKKVKDLPNLKSSGNRLHWEILKIHITEVKKSSFCENFELWNDWVLIVSKYPFSVCPKHLCIVVTTASSSV